VIGALNVHLQETLSGVEVVRAFGHEDDFIARFRLALSRTLDAYRRALSYNVFYTPLLTVLVATGVAFLLWVGTGGLGLTLGISIGTLTAFILLFQRFFEPIRNLGEDWQTVQSASSGIERIVQVLEIPVGHDSSPKPVSPVEITNDPAPSSNAVVELRDVSFGYLLRAIAFIIKQLQSFSTCTCILANLVYNPLSSRTLTLEEDYATESTVSHHY
jgi:ATP-binding cassette subfamily B protein